MTGSSNALSVTVPCVGCHSTAARGVLTVPSRQGTLFSLVQCGTCGLVQASPFPSAQQLQEYYCTYSYANPDVWQSSPGLKQSLARLVETFAPLRRSNRLLDVGCGAGHLLKVASQQGWEAEGVELSEVAASRLQEEGFAVQRGMLPDLWLDAGRFDVIVMAEVVEHLPDPVPYLETCYRLLRSGGMLYLTTPNFASLARRVLRQRWRAIEVPEHLLYFSPTPMRQLLRRIGFQRVQMRTEGSNPVELVLCLTGVQRSESITCARQSSTALLDATARNPALWYTKSVLNTVLSLAKLGDSLKVRAFK